MRATNDVKVPALRYYGGKWALAPWIIAHFPPHRNYLEPFGGSAAVLLQKPLSELETYNDVDGRLVNFFRVVRDESEELIRRIGLTPWARAEYILGAEPSEDSIEDARRFFCRHWMSVRGTESIGENKNWRCLLHRDRRYGLIPAEMQRIGRGLYAIAKRLINVQIDNRDALWIIPRYDSPETLIYADPPYPISVRSGRYYTHEVDDQFHVELAALLHQCQGFVIISGYVCDLYHDLYDDWRRYDKEVRINSGGRRVESIWLSPRTVEVLEASQPPQLF